MKFRSTAYDKEMQRLLRLAVKGSGWKQAKGVVFRQIDTWFIAGHWRNVSADAQDGLRIEILAKPMAIDPMLWEVMNLPDNNAQPLSFRYWGAFTCGTPVLKTEIISATEPEKAIPLMLEALERMLPEVLHLLETKKFSELARNPAGIHDNWRMGETIIHALRLENEPELAIRYAQENEGTFSVSRAVRDPKTAGRTHNQLVASAIREETRRSLFKRLMDRVFRR